MDIILSKLYVSGRGWGMYVCVKGGGRFCVLVGGPCICVWLVVNVKIKGYRCCSAGRYF